VLRNKLKAALKTNSETNQQKASLMKALKYTVLIRCLGIRTRATGQG
jgi:hypothetical protein